MTTDRPRRRGGGRPTPADAALTVGALLLFADSFLHWERACVFVVRVAPICEPFWTAWSGRGTFAGAAMAILSAALAAWQVAVATGGTVAWRWLPSALRAQSDERRAGVSVGLAAATVLFGVVKLAFVVTDHSTYGSYIAVPLLLLIAAGAALKIRETRPLRS